MLVNEAKILSKLTIKDKRVYNWDHSKFKSFMSTCWNDMKESSAQSKILFCCYICEKSFSCWPKKLPEFIDRHLRGSHKFKITDLSQTFSKTVGYCFPCKAPLTNKKHFHTHYDLPKHLQEIYRVSGFTPEECNGFHSESSEAPSDYGKFSSKSSSSRIIQNAEIKRKRADELSEMVFINDVGEDGLYPYIFTAGCTLEISISLRNIGNNNIVLSACKLVEKPALRESLFAEVLGKFPLILYPSTTELVSLKLHSRTPVQDKLRLQIHLGEATLTRLISISAIEKTSTASLTTTPTTNESKEPTMTRSEIDEILFGSDDLNFSDDDVNAISTRTTDDSDLLLFPFP
jgi:hypothetical protein